MRNKKYVKYTSKFFAILMSAVLAGGAAVPVHAKEQKREDKTETVYVNSDAEGTVDQVVVSEWLQNHDGSSTLHDYSNLSGIKNIKGEETFTQDADGNLVWDADGNDIYYQGETEEELPVSMKVSYYLDGQKISPEELAGKSGRVKIRFDYYNHSQEKVKVKGTDYEIQTPFTMVTAMVLPADIFTNIQVTNGQVMADGDKNIVVGLAFPGLSDNLQLEDSDMFSDITIPDYVEVTADAKDFSLALTLTAASTGVLDEINQGDFGDVEHLQEDLDKLTDASKQLKNGSGELVDGLETLSTSFDSYTTGVSDVDAGVKELKKGLKTLDSKKDDLSDGATDLHDGLKTLKEGTKALKDGLKQYTGGVTSLDTGLQTANSGAQALNKGADTLQAGMKSYVDGASALKNGIDSLYTKVSAMGDISFPDKDSQAAVQNAAEKLEEDAKILQKNANEITKAVETLNNLSADVKSYNEEVEQKFSDAKAALNDVDKAASAQANQQISEQEDDLSNKATKQAVEQAKQAVDSQQDLTADEKQALKDALNSAIAVSVDVNNVTVDGTAKEAKEALGDAPVFDVSEVNVNLSDMESLLTDMKTQAAVLETFANNSSQLVDATKSLPALTDGVTALKNGADELTQNNDTLLSGMETLTDGLDDLAEGISTMKTGAAQLTDNNKSLNNGADAADKGADQLKDGSKELKKGIYAYTKGVGTAFGGASQLADGTAKLQGAGSLLTDGIDQLLSGAGTLSDGMTEFDKDGIGKLASFAGDDLQDVVHRLKAVKKADKSYTSFGGKQADASGSVRFIIETGAIEADGEE